jgi:hypothetical protein
MVKNKKIYLLDRKLKWKTFKMLQDKLVRDSGPVPMEVDKAYWHLLREGRILCWFADDMKNDMGIGLEIPARYKKWEKVMITDSKQYKD